MVEDLSVKDWLYFFGTCPPVRCPPPQSKDLTTFAARPCEIRNSYELEFEEMMKDCVQLARDVPQYRPALVELAKKMLWWRNYWLTPEEFHYKSIGGLLGSTYCSTKMTEQMCVHHLRYEQNP